MKYSTKNLRRDLLCLSLSTPATQVSGTLPRETDHLDLAASKSYKSFIDWLRKSDTSFEIKERNIMKERIVLSQTDMFL